MTAVGMLSVSGRQVSFVRCLSKATLIAFFYQILAIIVVLPSILSVVGAIEQNGFTRLSKKRKPQPPKGKEPRARRNNSLTEFEDGENLKVFNTPVVGRLL